MHQTGRMKRTEPKQGRRTQREIEELLSRYRESGKTISEFCQLEGVVETSLYRWLRKEQQRAEAPTLVEMTRPDGMGSCFGVFTPAGYRVEVPSCFPASGLKRLLGVLEGCDLTPKNWTVTTR